MAGLPSNALSKTISSTAQNSTSALAQLGPSISGDNSAQRRSGGSGSFGAGAVSRTSAAAPRNKQASRPQGKQSRRYNRVADEDAVDEAAAMRSVNSRKGQTSITHLMNFSTPPRPSHYYQQDNHRRSQRRTWGLGSGHHAVDKARFVHANYRFIVDPRGDYYEQSIDADVYLDWSTILQILVSPQSQAAACPICLGDPVAPRMAKCGHIFCLPCLIRYMHSGDDVEHAHDKRPRWKKCPICWDSIYISETRPVRWYIGQEGPAPRESEDIVLRLVTRAANSTLALPREGSVSSSKGEDIPWHYVADVMDFARVMRGTTEYMERQYTDEEEQLREMERYDELMFGEDSEWTGKAIRSVKESKERLKELSNLPPPAKPEDAKHRKRLVPGQDPDTAVAMDGGSPQKSGLMPSLAQYRNQQQNISRTPTDYHFYQALLHYYLSPLDIRILRAAFGEFTSFPSTILPRVERVSTGHVIDDDMRKKTKYLAHLPHGCEVNFLECDWTDTVPPEVLDTFKAEIERRRKKNSDKEAREERDRVRAEKEEEAKGWAAARRKHGSSPVNRFQTTDFQPLVPSMAEASGSVESTSPMWNSGGGNGSAFATLGSPGTSPNSHRTVWGTSAITPSSPGLHGVQPDLGPVDDGWLQDWEKELLAEEELIARVAAASLGGESSSAGAISIAVGGSAKKKKNKKITLMSTTARRGA